MRSVVTGGAGFIGSHIVDALLKKESQVLVIDDFSSGRLENLKAAMNLTGNVEVVEADVRSEEAAREIIKFKPETVFHQAAQMNVRRSVTEPQFDASVNVVGTINMLEAASSAGAKCFVLASTGGAIYGEQDVYPAPESHCVQPECPYGVSKRSAELYVDFYTRTRGMSGVALRYANVYGPRQNPKGEAGVVAIFIERLFANEPLKINGDGEQTRDFVNVHDVVNANLSAAGGATNSGFFVYNVGTEIETSVLVLAEQMKTIWTEMNDSSVTVQIQHGPDLVGEQKRSVVDVAKIKAELAWKPTVPLRDGLSETVESFRSSRNST